MNDGLTDFGQIPVQPMEPMRIDDSYALCFALLYLAEADDDLPWLYGACCGFMGEVTESLPWGIFEYDELDDDIWEDSAEEAELPKSISIPEMYSRRYRMKGDAFDFPRSLAQIIYEETGCVLPRNLHLYDSKAKMLGKYGIKGKDAANALMLMSTLGATRRMTTTRLSDTFPLQAGRDAPNRLRRRIGEIDCKGAVNRLSREAPLFFDCRLAATNNKTRRHRALGCGRGGNQREEGRDADISGKVAGRVRAVGRFMAAFAAVTLDFSRIWAYNVLK